MSEKTVFFYFFRKPEENHKTHKKPEKNHKKSRLFKVVVNFQPWWKKENKTSEQWKIQVPFMKPIE